MQTEVECPSCRARYEATVEDLDGPGAECPECGHRVGYTEAERPPPEIPLPMRDFVLASPRGLVWTWREVLATSVAAGVLVLDVVQVLRYRDALPFMAELSGSLVAGVLSAIVLVALAVGLAFLAACWLLFPVIVFYYLRRIDRVMERMAKRPK